MVHSKLPYVPYMGSRLAVESGALKRLHVILADLDVSKRRGVGTVKNSQGHNIVMHWIVVVK
jgi:hypothetical protein